MVKKKEGWGREKADLGQEAPGKREGIKKTMLRWRKR